MSHISKETKIHSKYEFQFEMRNFFSLKSFNAKILINVKILTLLSDILLIKCCAYISRVIFKESHNDDARQHLLSHNERLWITLAFATETREYIKRWYSDGLVR